MLPTARQNECLKKIDSLLSTGLSNSDKSKFKKKKVIFFKFRNFFQGRSLRLLAAKKNLATPLFIFVPWSLDTRDSASGFLYSRLGGPRSSFGRSETGNTDPAQFLTLSLFTILTELPLKIPNNIFRFLKRTEKPVSLVPIHL